jgi:TonB-dependent SusC/RagA subfamily outer membrane receptor
MRSTFVLILLISSLIFVPASGQKNNKKITVTGIVTDSGQRPLSGALLMVDGTNTGIATDNSGYYKLRVKPDADSITVVTFTSGVRTLPIQGKTTINFVMGGNPGPEITSNVNPGNEKKIDIGYGNVSQKDVLTQVNTVDARSHKYDSYKNIYEILKGLPGVVVKGNSIQIQGPSSFTSGTEPIYVVDGMVVESIDGISPSMVESISVLKGASASIYGSRGANGAILITLINGKEKSRK